MGFIRNGQPLRAGKAFTDEDGTQYPKNWATVFSEEQKTALGISWEADPAPYDKRFYWGRDADGELLPKRVDDENAIDGEGEAILDADGNQVVNYGLKTEWVKKQKEIAGSLLASSDWYVTRQFETSEAMPTAVSDYRTAVRNICDTREAEIAACTTTQELAALLTNSAQVYDEATDSMVANTEPFITPWPEQD
jgi:hypothetical protein